MALSSEAILMPAHYSLMAMASVHGSTRCCILPRTHDADIPSPVKNLPQIHYGSQIAGAEHSLPSYSFPIALTHEIPCMPHAFPPQCLPDAADVLGITWRGPNLALTTVSTDSRQLAPGALFVALTGENFDGHNFISAARERGASAAVVNRKVRDPLPQLCVPDTRLALGQLAAARRAAFTQPLIALTGSNGKTTLKEMIAAILRLSGVTLATRGNLNNDIGVPLTLLGLQPQHRYAVIEMGANHPQEIAYLTSLAQPDVAIINNAGPCHLEGFGDVAGVARSKGEIFQGLSADGVAIINSDDAYAPLWKEMNQGRRIVDFALERPATVTGELLGGKRFRLHTEQGTQEISLHLAGQHNVRNALAAAAAALSVGATLDQVREGLENLQAVSGRMQCIAGKHGGTIIHDAYNANPASLAAALFTLAEEAGRNWLVLGDMRELGADAAQLHAQAGEQARLAGFERLFALGEHSQAAVSAFGVGAAHFTSAEDLSAALDEELQKVGALLPLILVKGSRGMRMERIVTALAAPDSCPAESRGKF